ncbi:hypothetical protein D3C81_1294040 [compost metagenome]
MGEAITAADTAADHRPADDRDIARDWPCFGLVARPTLWVGLRSRPVVCRRVPGIVVLFRVEQFVDDTGTCPPNNIKVIVATSSDCPVVNDRGYVVGRYLLD